MNIENRSMRPSILVSALSVLCFWAFVACLTLLLAERRGGDMGNGDGIGAGSLQGTGGGSTPGASGPGNEKSGAGAGAAAKESNGTDTGKEEQGTQGEGGKKDVSPESDKDASGEETVAVDDDSDEEGDGGDDDVTVLLNQPTQNVFGEHVEAKVTRKTPEERPQPKIKRGKTKLSGSEAGKLKGFFGSGSLKGDILFLVDVSGSMMGQTPEHITRLELLKRELKKTLTEKLNALPSKLEQMAKKKKYGKFKIATFSDTTFFYPENKEMLSFGSKKDLENAIQFVDNLNMGMRCPANAANNKAAIPQPTNMGGGTSMMSAWNDCMALLTSNEIDWVYFLSDGEPSDCNETSLLKSLEKIKPNINTFSLGMPSHLMESVAKAHKGNYWEIY